MDGNYAPRLLVSVRSVNEARAALRGGTDILDVKDPERGSLGHADFSVVRELSSLAEVESGRVPLSVALGEVDEVDGQSCEDLPEAVRYAKLGLARLRHRADWVERWLEVRRSYEQRAAIAPGWIAVIYADEAADSPRPADVIDVAVQTRCCGVLVDTCDKLAGRLFDCVPPLVLADWCRKVRQHGLLFAVAGRLQREDLQQVRAIGPDVIAVRSAVCRHQDRRASVCQHQTDEFRSIMKCPDTGPRLPVSRR